MISVTEATRIIQSNLFKPKKEAVKLESATGRIVAESIFADRDFPPFNRATMDGIAIDANALFREDTNQGLEQLGMAGTS